MWKNGNLRALLVEMSNGAALWQSLVLLPKVKHRTIPHAPATPLLGLHPKEPKAATQTGICMPMLFTRVTRCKQPKCPSMEEWTNKM